MEGHSCQTHGDQLSPVRSYKHDAVWPSGTHLEKRLPGKSLQQSDSPSEEERGCEGKPSQTFPDNPK